MPPQTNARLIAVNTDGGTPDWDTPGGSGTLVWSGSANAYVQEKVRTNYSQQASALAKSKDLQIVIDAPLARTIGITSEHILTFVWRGQTLSRRVMEYNGADMGGVPNYRRIHLNSESVEVTNASDE